ncbi:MAG: carboxypeptidase-like regulatory domain-containing protein [Reichenbachiella sp.]
MKVIIALFFLLSCSNLFAQNIEGNVSDFVSGEKLLGAAVTLSTDGKGSVTDEKGNFIISDLSPGLYELTISYLGYLPKVIPEIWVKNGKTSALVVRLKRDPQQLDEVVVSSTPNIAKLSAIRITEEKINRYAASYNDPSRLAIASSDAMVSNDQNNQISVRGLSPTLNVWRLEGVEIVNPNHLSNAGTFNDQPAATGGGVNIISAQMLDNSEFLVGHMDNSYNNGVAGIFDMNLRNGYNGGHQFTAQASFIGFDFSAEGPLSKSSNASYLANYRYSFTGLLGLMGVDFGGETIGYQDLSFNVNLPLKNNASIKVFALGGLSENDFSAKSLEESEYEKDRSDILFNGKMGAIGAKYETPLSKNLRLSLTSVFSMGDDQREQTSYTNLEEPWMMQFHQQKNSLWSNRLHFIFNQTRSMLETGVTFNAYSFDYQNENDFQDLSIESSLSQLAPYANWQYALSNMFSLNMGLTYYYISREDQSESEIDYRLSLDFENNNTGASLAFGKYSQVQLPYKSFVSDPYQQNDFFYVFGLMTSYRYIANVQQQFNSTLIKLEGFYYHFPEIVQPQNNNDPYAANTYGASLNISSTTQFLYYDIGATVFNSTFGDGNSNPFDVQQSYSASFGKKWDFEGGEKSRTLSVNVKGIYQGGLHQLYDSPEYKSQLNDYARLDFRIQWVKSKTKTTTSWSLDIQNITNRQNEAFQYYDSFTGQIETNYQLGLIPVLTYRIEF